MTLAASKTLVTNAKIEYHCTLFRGEALHQFDSLYADVESANPLTVETISLELASYLFPVNYLLNQKRAMRRGMRKPHGLKVRQYSDRLIGLNWYLDSFPGATLSRKTGVTELNEFFLIVGLIVGSSKHICRGFSASLILFKSS